MTRVISDIENKNNDGNYLFAIMVGDRLEQLLKKLLDEDEFLTGYGIRSLSKHYQANPFVFGYQENDYRIQYEPVESSSSMFGGNSRITLLFFNSNEPFPSILVTCESQACKLDVPRITAFTGFRENAVDFNTAGA